MTLRNLYVRASNKTLFPPNELDNHHTSCGCGNDSRDIERQLTKAVVTCAILARIAFELPAILAERCKNCMQERWCLTFPENGVENVLQFVSVDLSIFASQTDERLFGFIFRTVVFVSLAVLKAIVLSK